MKTNKIIQLLEEILSRYGITEIFIENATVKVQTKGTRARLVIKGKKIIKK